MARLDETIYMIAVSIGALGVLIITVGLIFAVYRSRSTALTIPAQTAISPSKSSEPVTCGRIPPQMLPYR